MEGFEAPVPLGMAWRDAFWGDAEFDEADGERGEAAEAGGRERGAVVGSDDGGSAKGGERRERLRRLTSPSRSRMAPAVEGAGQGRSGWAPRRVGMIFLGPSSGAFRLASTIIAARLGFVARGLRGARGRSWRPASPSWLKRLMNLPEYDDGVEVRRVRSNGEIKWAGERVFLSEALVGEPVGLVLHDDRSWAIRFGHLEVGLLDGHAMRIIKTPVRALPMYQG